MGRSPAAVNALLASAKLVAGLAGHSHALTADAVESLADVFSSLVVWRGLVVAAAPADEDHPYGHGKAEPIAAATVSAFLLLIAVWICVRSAQAASQPHSAPAPFTLLVLAAAMTVKEGLFRFIRQESLSVGSSAMHADAWHHRSDAITSLAAAVGISVALTISATCAPHASCACEVASMVASLFRRIWAMHSLTHSTCCSIDTGMFDSTDGLCGPVIVNRFG